ncbi:MAG: hypothetical protein SCH66_01725 [Methanolobus sp.]|nr:hypothetical protein [Methanolobus sp.]
MKSLSESEKAVSAVVGVLIILALTITSISVILLYATPTINDMQDMANAQRVEQAFTVFDSRTSKVALGESPSQTTSFSIMDGSIEVNGNNGSYNESKIVIVCANISALPGFQTNRYRWRSWEPHMAATEMNQFNASMGSITYTKEDRVIGYEGGGVWSKYPTGKAVMISPPEFHYNGETLTLPIMKISGNEVSSGTADVDVTVSSDNMPTVMYPDPSADSRRINPLDSDKVLIYIKSDFYTAWADYANSLAYASAVTDDANKTAVIELEVIPAMGKDKLKQEIKIGAVNQENATPMGSFTLNLGARSSQGLNPNNYQITATSGTKTLKYTLQKKGNDKLEIGLVYEDTASGGGIETWAGDGDYFVITGEKEDSEATVDLLSATLDMKYLESSDFSWDSINCTTTTSLPLYDLTQHYMKLITLDGSVLFNIYSPGGSDPVDYDESTLTLYYDGMPGSITYLHVSRNDLSATLN